MADNLKLGNCHACGARVMLKINKGGKVYYYCTGDEADDGKGCNASFKWGGAMSRAMIANQAKEARNDDQPQPIDQPARGTGDDAGARPVRKRRGLF